MWVNRLKLFLSPFDKRFEDLSKGKWHLNVLRDFTAGLIVAMVAIAGGLAFGLGGQNAAKDVLDEFRRSLK